MTFSISLVGPDATGPPRLQAHWLPQALRLQVVGKSKTLRAGQQLLHLLWVAWYSAILLISPLSLQSHKGSCKRSHNLVALYHKYTKPYIFSLRAREPSQGDTTGFTTGYAIGEESSTFNTKILSIRKRKKKKEKSIRVLFTNYSCLPTSSPK